MKTLAFVQIGSALVAGAIAICAALAGAGYWAVVVQILAMDAITAAVLLTIVGRPRLKASRRSFAELWNFSSRVMLFQVINYAIRNADNVLIGRYLGAASLAFYAVSYRVMMLPVQGLGQVANKVAFPIYSRLQDDRERLARQFLRAAQMLSLVALPLMCLVALGAPVLVPTLLGAAWEPAVVPLQILSFVGAQQVVHTTVGPVFMACGRADWLARWGFFAGAVLISAFVIGLNWGVVGVAAAYAIASLVISPIPLYLTGKLAGFGLTEFGRKMVPATVSTVALALGWWGSEVLLAPFDISSLTTACVAGIAGSVCYALVLRGCWPKTVSEGTHFVALLLGRS